MSIGVSIRVEGSVPTPDFSGAIERTHSRVGRLGVAAARANFSRHTKTGETIRNLRSRTLAGGVEFFDPAPQASFVEYGTKPHIIRPKNARALRWVGESGPIFAASVRHPGTGRSRGLRRPSRTMPRR